MVNDREQCVRLWVPYRCSQMDSSLNSLKGYIGDYLGGLL